MINTPYDPSRRARSGATLRQGLVALALTLALLAVPPMLPGPLAVGFEAQAQTIDACDWEAAHPSDPDRVGAGRGSGEVDTGRAIAACEDAVRRHPETARFHYQLGRAQVYAADRDGTDWTVGMPALIRAAELQHRQAMFVLGLMRKREGDVCASEPLTRGAADLGLKSARISYVNDHLSGAFERCAPEATLAQMSDYLAAARSQVSGYYENMLLDALGRQLQVAMDAQGASS